MAEHRWQRTVNVRPSDTPAGVLLEFGITGGEKVQRIVAANINTRQYIAQVDITTPPGPGPLLVKKTQGDNSGIDIPLTLSFPPVIQGHLLVLAFVTSGTGTHQISGPGGTGWATAAGPGSHSSIYWKVASSGDAALNPFSVTVDDNTAVNITRKAFLLQYEQMAASAIADVGAFVNTTGSVTTRSSGTTGTTAQANELAVAIFGQGSGGTTNQAWTNGFTVLSTVQRGWLVSKILASTQTVETTMTWTTSATMTAAIATFKAAQAAAGPVSPRQQTMRFVEFEVEAAGVDVVWDEVGMIPLGF
jgi:hypothetical protein